MAAAVVRNLAWQDSARKVAHAHEMIERLEEISLASMDAENDARESAETMDPRDLTRCVDDLNRAKQRENELETEVSGDAAQRKNALVIRRLIDRQRDAITNGARSGSRDDMIAALSSLARAGFSSSLRAAVLEMENEQRLMVRDRTAFEEQTTGVSRTLLLVAALFSIGLICAAGWRMSLDLRKRSLAEHALVLKEEQYRHVVELAGDIICRTDAQGGLLSLISPPSPCCT